MKIGDARVSDRSEKPEVGWATRVDGLVTDGTTRARCPSRLMCTLDLHGQAQDDGRARGGARPIKLLAFGR